MKPSPLALLALAATGRGQTAPPAAPLPFSPTAAVSQAFGARATITTNRQRLEEARRNAFALGSYPATRFDLGRNLFNDVDILGSADLLVYQPLDVFNKAGVYRNQGNAALAAALAAFRQGALNVQSEVLGAYASVGSAQRLLDVARRLRAIADELRSSAERRVAARDLPEIQAERARIEVQRADGLVADREAAVEVAKLRLAAALGSDTVPSDPQLPALDAPPVIAGDPTAGRPELLVLRTEVALAAADERVARVALLPDVEIQAGRNSFALPAQYGARLQITGTLYDNGATRNRRRAAAARKAAAFAALADRERGARKDIEASLAEYRASEASLARYNLLVGAAQTLLGRTQRGFELGASTLIDVLDARRALSDAQELVANAALRRDLAVAGVLTAEGRFLNDPDPNLPAPLKAVTGGAK